MKEETVEKKKKSNAECDESTCKKKKRTKDFKDNVFSFVTIKSFKRC